MALSPSIAIVRAPRGLVVLTPRAQPFFVPEALLLAMSGRAAASAGSVYA